MEDKWVNAGLAARRKAGGARARIRMSWRRLRCMLFGAGWLFFLPASAAPAESIAVPATPDAGILVMRDYIMSRLRAMPGVDVGAMSALEISGRCAPATPCRETTVSAVVTAPPLQVSTMVCAVDVHFDGVPLGEMAMEGRGRGAGCEVAQRDAPLQIAARILEILKEEVHEWSEREKLARLIRVLEALDSGLDRLRESAPAAATEVSLEAIENQLRDLER